MSVGFPRRSSAHLLVSIVVTGLVAAVLGVAPAQAQDIDSLRARASSLADELEKVERQASIADEEWLAAADELEGLRTDINATKASITEAEGRVADAEAQAEAFLVSAYMDAGSTQAITSAGGDVNRSLNQQVLLDTLRGDREQLTEQLAASRGDLADRQADLETQEARVVEVESERKAARVRLEGLVERQQDLYDQAQGDLQDALEAERRRRAEEAARRAAEQAAAAAAAEAAAAQAAQAAAPSSSTSTTAAPGSSATTPGSSTTAPGSSTTAPGSSTTAPSGGGSRPTAPPPPPPRPVAPPPPTSGGAAGAIAAAKSMLGTPYRWGGSSPSTGFDCSGLLMWAWAQVGVGLPHSSRAMYSATQRVSLSQIAPGDLVFYGSPIHHVSMYVGGGQVIDSPRTGLSVRIVPMGYTGRIVGVGRVR